MKKYRPFNSPKELKDFWNQSYSDGIVRPSFTNPDIWVKLNGFNSEFKLTAFHDSGVDISGDFCSYEDLVKKYTFLDGLPCGISG